jgi:ADP-ribosylglycohydrolase
VDATGVEAYASKVRGCLLGGAVGDALGAPVEFDSLDEIREKHGPDGVRAYARSSGGGPTYGAITDDTQMTLFTVEGLIRAGVRTDRGIGFTLELVHAAYDRWLDTQTLPGPPDRPYGGWLATEAWLYSRRAPGDTCLSALSNARAGTDRIRLYGAQVINRSKGCGAVMRSAPFGLLPRDQVPVETVFEWADEAAGWTHGHPSGRLPAGALAAIVAGLVDGLDLPAAVDAALAILRPKRNSAETVTALEAAVAAATAPPSIDALTLLGGGWVGEEALAIAVYAALSCPEPAQFLDALALSVSHGGDSDSTGAICGNILGTRHGAWAVPPELAFEVEGRGTILQLADDFVYEFTDAQRRLHGAYGPDTRWPDRYPPG